LEGDSPIAIYVAHLKGRPDIKSVSLVHFLPYRLDCLFILNDHIPQLEVFRHGVPIERPPSGFRNKLEFLGT